jgi:hypothetical protein
MPKLGYKQTEEHRVKNSEGHKRHNLSAETLLKMSRASKSRLPFSKEHLRKISEALKGKKASLETRLKMSKNRKGKKKSPRSEIYRKHISESKMGEKNNWWRGGLTPINKAIRKSFEYKKWRKAVFERDNYTCIWCGQRGGEIQADHIKPFSLFPELRFVVANGRTLCRFCHLKTDTWGNRTDL